MKKHPCRKPEPNYPSYTSNRGGGRGRARGRGGRGQGRGGRGRGRGGTKMLV
ncbi:hypothetical protein Tco_0495072, partial [Tanacetum coccineum]